MSFRRIKKIKLIRKIELKLYYFPIQYVTIPINKGVGEFKMEYRCNLLVVFVIFT